MEFELTTVGICAQFGISCAPITNRHDTFIFLLFVSVTGPWPYWGIISAGLFEQEDPVLIFILSLVLIASVSIADQLGEM